MTPRDRQPKPVANQAKRKIIQAFAIMCSMSGLVALSACGDPEPEVPIGFELTSRTVINNHAVITVRDIGTGCEIIISQTGIMPRNERSVDGATVKQRCVLTGTEQPMPATTTVLPANPAQTSAMDAEAAAVADAVREATTPAPNAGNIPPPSGEGAAPREVPADDEDGIESQLKN